MSFDCAAACGIYCGHCSKYKEGICKGCHSDQHVTNHKRCEIYKCCVIEKKKKWCFQCRKFPCNEMITFTQWRSWINHKECIKNLYKMKDIGVEKWLKGQKMKDVE